MTLVENIIDRYLSDQQSQNVTYVGMDTEEDIVAIRDSTTPKFLLGIVFKQDDGSGGKAGLWTTEVRVGTLLLRVCVWVSGRLCL